MPFTPEQVQRYARHLILPEVGSIGQRKLLDARVLLLGAGGLGSPAALYLAAAGVGHLGIVDADVVDLTNLQRQILHHTSDVGRLKVDSASSTLHAINPGVEVITHPTHIDSTNALAIFANYDIILDGTDNFPTRYLANDAAYFSAKPLIQASIFRFEGNLAMFDPAHTPGCYRCLFPSPPAPGDVPSCAEAGVFGVLPGILGSLMAFEAIKFLIGYGESMVGSLLVFEGYDLSFRKLKTHAMPNCPLCSANRTLTGLIDYEYFCGIR